MKYVRAASDPSTLDPNSTLGEVRPRTLTPPAWWRGGAGGTPPDAPCRRHDLTRFGFARAQQYVDFEGNLGVDSLEEKVINIGQKYRMVVQERVD